MAANDIDASITKRTQESIGKYVKKPPLTEKLLKKPPFRFLHDVFNVVINETGYFAGLYTPDELNIENIKDRDDKMRFLQKMIDVIKICTGANLTVRTSKIVAGHEADKTNELLQLMGRVIEKKMEWQSAVQLVVSGKADDKKVSSKILDKTKNNKNKDKTQEHTKTKESKGKESREEDAMTNSKQTTPTNRVEKQITKPNDSKAKGKVTEKSKTRTKVDAKTVREQNGKNGKIIPKRADSVEKQKGIGKEKTSSSKVRTSTSTKDIEKPEKKSDHDENEVLVDDTKHRMKLEQVSPEASLERNLNKLSEHTTDLEKSTIQNNELKMPLAESVNAAMTTGSPIKTSPPNHHLIDTIDLKNPESSGSRKSSSNKSRRSSANKTVTEKKDQGRDQQQNVLMSATNEESKPLSERDEVIDVGTTQNHHQNNSNISSSINNNLANYNKNNTNEVKRESTFTRENSKDLVTVSNNQHGNNTNNTVIDTNIRPRTSLRPPSARPASARPGAPRRRDKNVEIVLQPNDQIKLSGINVKLDSFGDFGDDDGDNLVIIEDANTVLSGIDSENRNSTNNENANYIDDAKQQGHLVQQILETQKELVQNNEILGQPETKDINNVNGIADGARQSSARQMNNLRDIIQNLTKSVNPFGKLMDFIPEDIDAMHLELSMWRESYAMAASDLKRERSLTESTIEPMKVQLIQIESSINEYLEMTDVSRMKILRNSNKITQLLTEQ